MKLFQRLLVAPAALGLFSPLAANATEVNLNEIANYSDVESIEFTNSFDNKELTNSSLLAGGEGLVESYDGGFSETTTASFSVDFAIGSEDGKGLSTGVTDGDEDIQAIYGFQIDLNTSFTGEDSLDISIDAGNGVAAAAGVVGTPLYEFDLNGGTDGLSVDGVSYTWPVGDNMTAIVGDNTDGSALFTTACAYGGPSNTLDDCGNVNAGITNGGAMAGASYDFGNGFTAAIGYAGPETGIMTDESLDAYGLNAAYTADNYGVSVTYGVIESNDIAAGEENTYTAVNGYYTLDNGVSISAGYELGDLGGASAATDESTNYFVGVNAEVGPGELGAAMGTYSGQREGTDEELMYEAYYAYPVNDGMTITPLLYIKENAEAGTPDLTGVMVKTSFSF
tara:strand:+ start:160 stop:1344 length:1185 start_codon:yes stop_codon:yes gene_type:complete